MNIFFPINLKPTGGSSTFANKFQVAARSLGHQVSFTPNRHYDALLVSTSCPFRYLLHAAITRRPIIHRLDGIYYPSTIAGYNFPLYNLKPFLIRHFFAHTTIYQSQYSKFLCDKFLGSSRKPHHFIFNGVNIDTFTPYGDEAPLRQNPNQHVFITASRFRRRDQIIPLILAFKHYREHFNPNSHLYVIGSFEGKVEHLPSCLAGHSHLTFMDAVSNQDLPNYLRAADIFLFTHQNPPCPNNIIEAMACGLPICAVNDGAMSELTKPGLNSELIPAFGAGIISPRHLDIAALASNLDKIMKRHPHYSHYSRQTALAKFNIEDMANKYLAVINEL